MVFYNKKNNYINHRRYFYLVFAFLPMISGIYLLFAFNNSSFSLLPFLPFVYSLSYVLFIGTSGGLTNSVVRTIVVIGSYIRMVVIPVLIALSGFQIWLGHYITFISTYQIEAVMPIALLMMCYEHIFIFLAASLKHSHNLNSNIGKSKKSTSGLTSDALYNFIIIILIFFVVGFGFIYPSLHNYISFAFNTSSIIGSEVNIQGSSPSVVYRLYMWFIDILQLIIPTSCVLYLKKSNLRKDLRLLLFILVDLLTLLFMTYDKVLSILYALLLLVWFMQDYKHKPKLLTIGIGAIVLFGLFSLMQKNLIDRYSGHQLLIIFNGMLNAYFSGPFNVAASIVMTNDIPGGARIVILLGDLLNSVPFLPVFFQHMNTTPRLFNQVIKGSDQIATKIIPLIGQGYFYLTAVFAPLMSFLVIRIAMRFENKMLQLKNSFSQFIFLFIATFCAITPIMYNANILIKSLCNTAVIYYLIALRHDSH